MSYISMFATSFYIRMKRSLGCNNYFMIKVWQAVHSICTKGQRIEVTWKCLFAFNNILKHKINTYKSKLDPRKRT